MLSKKAFDELMPKIYNVLLKELKAMKEVK